MAASVAAGPTFNAGSSVWADMGLVNKPGRGQPLRLKLGSRRPESYVSNCTVADCRTVSPGLRVVCPWPVRSSANNAVPAPKR